MLVVLLFCESITWLGWWWSRTRTHLYYSRSTSCLSCSELSCWWWVLISSLFLNIYLSSSKLVIIIMQYCSLKVMSEAFYSIDEFFLLRKAKKSSKSKILPKIVITYKWRLLVCSWGGVVKSFSKCCTIYWFVFCVIAQTINFFNLPFFLCEHD